MTPSETMTPHPEEKKKGLNGIKKKYHEWSQRTGVKMVKLR